MSTAGEAVPHGIRLARAADAPTLALLLGELGFATCAEDLLPRLERLQGNGDGDDAVLVAERAAQVVGLVALHVMQVLHRPAPVGRITAFVVAEAARGEGVGTALLDAAERRLIARGCGLLEVTSNRRLVQAHAFYERRGYAITSVRFAKAVPA